MGVPKTLHPKPSSAGAPSVPYAETMSMRKRITALTKRPDDARLHRKGGGGVRLSLPPGSPQDHKPAHPNIPVSR